MQPRTASYTHDSRESNFPRGHTETILIAGPENSNKLGLAISGRDHILRRTLSRPYPVPIRCHDALQSVGALPNLVTMASSDPESRSVSPAPHAGSPTNTKDSQSPATTPAETLSSKKRTASTSEPAGASKITKRRAARACVSCRARKVRCDVVEGAPCGNCRWDNVTCVVQESRRRK